MVQHLFKCFFLQPSIVEEGSASTPKLILIIKMPPTTSYLKDSDKWKYNFNYNGEIHMKFKYKYLGRVGIYNTYLSIIKEWSPIHGIKYTPLSSAIALASSRYSLQEYPNTIRSSGSLSPDPSPNFASWCAKNDIFSSYKHAGSIMTRTKNFKTKHAYSVFYVGSPL